MTIGNTAVTRAATPHAKAENSGQNQRKQGPVGLK